MPHRNYYDHEPAYRQRANDGHTGWSIDPNDAAFDAFHQFLDSSHFPKTPGIALDLGCGGGQVTLSLAQSGWQVVGLEYSESALIMARNNARPYRSSTVFARADLTRLWPVPVRTFDLIVDNHVLHCLIEPSHRSEFLSQARAALRPGGTFFSANMSAEGKLDRVTLNIRPDHINADRNRIWQPIKTLKQEFIDAGFKINQVDLLDDPNDPKFGKEALIIGE